MLQSVKSLCNIIGCGHSWIRLQLDKMPEIKKKRVGHYVYLQGLTHAKIEKLKMSYKERKQKNMWIKNCKTWYSEEEYKEPEERINQQHTNVMRNNLQYHNIDTTNKKYKSALEEIREIAENSCSIPCSEIGCDCKNCSDEITNNGETCMQYGLDKIISKIKEVLK